MVDLLQTDSTGNTKDSPDYIDEKKLEEEENTLSEQVKMCDAASDRDVRDIGINQGFGSAFFCGSGSGKKSSCGSGSGEGGWG